MARRVEEECVEQAEKNVEKLTMDHATYTRRWAEASEMQQAVLKKTCDELEDELAILRPRTRTISQRLNELKAAGGEVSAKRQQLLADLPAFDCREKGEALRRVFKTVRLYWDQRFIKRSKSPKRPLKTKRPGRNSFTLLKDKTGWEFSTFNLNGSS